MCVRSAAVSGEAVGRVAGVAAAVLPAHIGNGGVWALGLHPECRNQRVLRVDGDAVGLALGHKAYCVMRCHLLDLTPQT